MACLDEPCTLCSGLPHTAAFARQPAYCLHVARVEADLTGTLVVNKPAGWTSHDVVARVRRLAGMKRVGHAGTLDPMATGVLPVLLGRATRLADYVGAGRKRYEATVMLGAATDTDDADGEVVARAPVAPLDLALVEAALARFRGEVKQVPPAYSAVKVAGQRAYAVARKGGNVALTARPVTIYSLDLLGIRENTLELDIRCSRGTYVRALARDLARALGTVGHLTRLVRTEVGSATLADAFSLAQIAERGVATCLRPPDHGLDHLAAAHMTEQQATDIRHGRPVPATGLMAESVRVYDPSGRMLCIAAADGTWLRPRFLLVPAEQGAGAS